MYDSKEEVIHEKDAIIYVTLTSIRLAEKGVILNEVNQNPLAVCLIVTCVKKSGISSSLPSMEAVACMYVLSMYERVDESLFWVAS